MGFPWEHCKLKTLDCCNVSHEPMRLVSQIYCIEDTPLLYIHTYDLSQPTRAARTDHTDI
jgi:hypothetical protein